MFPEYLKAVLERLKERQVHVTLETSGSFDYDVFAQAILPHVDLVLYDVKLIDRAASLRYLGQPSGRILGNLRRLLGEIGVKVHPRIPVIPGVTDGRENLAAIVGSLRNLGAAEVSLVPYNPLGFSMYPQLGRPAPELPAGFVEPQREKDVLKMFREIVNAA